MKRIVILLIVLLIAIYTFAQTPEWQWANQAGGTSHDNGRAVSTDADGNVYLTGNFRGTANFGSFSITHSGQRSIFVAKMDSDGNWLWAKSAGGNDPDSGHGISIDADGNVYVTGYFLNTASFGSVNLISNGDTDIYLAKMDTNGNWLWAESAGGNYSDSGSAVSTDIDGNVYVTGHFYDTANFGSVNLTSNGDSDIFLAKMDSNGNWLWAESAGGSNVDFGHSVSTDFNGNIYVTGAFRGTASFSSFNLISNGDYDIFVAKMDANGNWLWAESAGGNYSDYGSAVSIDTEGNVNVAGAFEETSSFGSFNLISNGSRDIYVAKMDSNGNWLWAENAGGISWDFGPSICTDVDSNIYLTGYYSNSVSFGSFHLTSSGGSDIFVAKMDSNGNWLWAENAGGNYNDHGLSISINSDENVYVTGAFIGTASFGSFNLTSSGFSDIFVAKIGNITSAENEIITTNNIISNYPNPFNPLTNIQFDIRENETGILSIYNIKGQLIELQQVESGQHNYIWDASKQSSGIYFYKLETENMIETRKMLLLK